MLKALAKILCGASPTPRFDALLDEHRRVAEKSIENSQRNSGFARDLQAQASGAIRTLSRHWDANET